MAAYRIIDDFSVGDTYKLIRLIDTVPDGQTISDAYWTVKASMLGGAPEFIVHIIPATTGMGSITTSENGTVTLQFIATSDVSVNMVMNTTYYYDVHVNFESGETYMLESGKLFTGYSVLGAH